MTASLLRLPRHQHGGSLVEAMISFAILAISLVAVGQLQSALRRGVDLSRQRADAVRLAEQGLETMRTVPAASAPSPGSDGASSAAAFRVTRRADDDAIRNASLASVGVTWTDRAGAIQNLRLDSIVASVLPEQSGALALAPGGAERRGAFGRAAGIPVAAKDLGDGRSVFKPVGSGRIAYVFENRSGALVGRCEVDLAIAARSLAAADLADCDARRGLLLSGVVRFAFASPPDPGNAADAPLAVDVALALDGGSYPVAPACSVEPSKVVRYTDSAGTLTVAVPAEAVPASVGATSWVETGDRYTAYHCAVYPAADGRWSGRTTLVAGGWTIGTGAADRRVCRYSADHDGSGAIDRNAEHPAHYASVDGALANQNFLVVRGLDACPTGDASTGTSRVAANLATVPHQP